MNQKKKKILLVSSAGGHLAQILELKEFFENHNYLIITEDLEVTKTLSDQFNVEFVKPAGKGRNIRFFINLLINFFIALKCILKFRPDFIISTGSHTAVPYFYFGKIFRSKTIFILSFARIKSKALSASLIYPICDEFIVQWKTAKKLYPKSKFLESSLY